MKLFGKKIDDKGLSIVELICAIAIVSLLGTVVSSVLVVSSNTYRKGSAEADVQQEAQFVANQISDLIIDSTSKVEYKAADKELLIQQKDGSEYLIKYYDSNKVLKYKEKAAGATSYSEEQLLAEKVESFSANTSMFQTNGYIQLDIKVKNGTTVYPAVFTVTSRNASSDTNYGLSSTARITATVRKWLLEPNEEKDFGSYVSSSTGEALVWTVEGANDTTNTKMEGSKLTIGVNENAPSVKVKVALSTNPSVYTYITVYVRRVTGVTLGLTLTGGTNYEKDATYSLAYILSGTSLNKINGAEYDTNYVDTRTYTLTADPTTNITWLNSAHTAFKLNDDMADGEEIKFTIVAKHPAGANKKGVPYATVKAETSLKKASSFLTSVDDGWKRLSDSAQASVAMSKSDMIKALIALGKLDEPEEGVSYDIRHEYAVRLGKINSDGTYVLNEKYVDPAKLGADGYNSSVINIRPLLSGMMDYNYDYRVEITWSIWRIDGGRNEKIYYDVLSQTVKKVCVGYKLENTADAPYYYKWTQSMGVDLSNVGKAQTFMYIDDESITGIPGGGDNRIYNEMRPVLEYFNAKNNAWETASVSMKSTNGNLEFVEKPTKSGLYRVLLYANLPDLSAITFNAQGVPQYHGNKNYALFDDSYTDGVFYFTIKQEGDDGSGETVMYFNVPVASKTAVQGLDEASAPTVTFTRDQQREIITWNNKNSLDQNNEFKNNNFHYSVQKKNASGEWEAAGSDFYIQGGGTTCMMKAQKADLKGLYRVVLVVKDDAEEYFHYNLEKNKGVFYFWINERTASTSNPSDEDSSTGSETTGGSSTGSETTGGSSTGSETTGGSSTGSETTGGSSTDNKEETPETPALSYASATFGPDSNNNGDKCVVVTFSKEQADVYKKSGKNTKITVTFSKTVHSNWDHGDHDSMVFDNWVGQNATGVSLFGGLTWTGEDPTITVTVEPHN